MGGITSVVTASCLVLTLVLAAADVSGVWGMEANFDDGNLSGGGYDCSFKQDDERLTGNCMGIAIAGEVKGRQVSWRMKAGQTDDIVTFTATLSEDGRSLNGRFSVAGKGGRIAGTKQLGGQ